MAKDTGKNSKDTAEKLMKLQALNRQLKAANQQLRANEEKLKRLNHDLSERVKELNCLYGLSHLAERRDITLEEIFRGLAELIPPSWQYPEITGARITFENHRFKTNNFRKTAWMQSAEIKVSGRKAGTVEVCYLREKPIIDEGPFLEEERNLLDALAKRLAHIAERKQAEETLRAANQQLRASEQQLRAANQQLRATEQQLKAANQQLRASEQQLKAANQQLRAEDTERKRAEERLIDYQSQLKSLASQLTLAEEHERHRIATELHDQIGQLLIISKLNLDTVRNSGSAADIAKALNEADRNIEQIIQNLRSLTFELSSPLLYELGLEKAVAEWLTEKIRKKHRINTEFEDDGQHKPLDDDIRTLLFRDVRELLTNVVKHAQAKWVKVSIRKVESRIHISVKDDGWGFDPEKIAATAIKTGKFGFFSIRERLKQLGGSIEIESAPGYGTRIMLCAPLKQETENLN